MGSSIRTLQLSTISIKMKTVLVLIFTLALLTQGYALKCHVCTGTAGICETGKDPEEKTCASSEKSCLFMSSGTGDSKVEYKACSAIDKAICQDMTLGTTTAKACMCQMTTATRIAPPANVLELQLSLFQSSLYSLFYS